MARKELTKTTLKTLFGLSGNQCAFPGCSHPVINHKGQFVAQVAHINAAEPGGPRYVQNMSDDERRSPDNLLILCYQHHIETNDEIEFPTKKMVDIKSKHEGTFKYDETFVSDAVISRELSRINEYWGRIDSVNKHHLETHPVAYAVNTDSNFQDLVDKIREAQGFFRWYGDVCSETQDSIWGEVTQLLTELGYDTESFDSVRYYEHPCSTTRNWELHNLGVPNWLTTIEISLTHIEVLFWQECLRRQPRSTEIQKALEDAEARFEKLAGSAAHVD
jgi:hypothetical protein